jgi:hypothetical protein
MAYQITLRSGSLDPIGDVLGPVLDCISFPDGACPRVAGPSHIEQRKAGKKKG